MAMKNTDSKNLKKRYLLWLYKTTKEALDRIDRKFTQLEIDKLMLHQLEREARDAVKFRSFIAEFKNYIANKQKDSLALKYARKGLKPDYEFLALKLKAIEKAAKKELGTKGLREMKALYEKEMTERILKSTEHT